MQNCQWKSENCAFEMREKWRQFSQITEALLSRPRADRKYISFVLHFTRCKYTKEPLKKNASLKPPKPHCNQGVNKVQHFFKKDVHRCLHLLLLMALRESRGNFWSVSETHHSYIPAHNQITSKSRALEKLFLQSICGHYRTVSIK